ncbi:hypothetical protein E3N88_11054 [Mikania micrantha]|uniref:Uncharacterized protein n=1 Tax=Mikania micrantha TaxID=192012 RepID=A0A5N6PCN1_9ASTR|nr:hypothetical protein E3N88_11054 [Mikania micrantha]
MPETETPLISKQLQDLTIATFPTSLKLTSTNYLGWKTQIEALLHGLDLYKYIDGSLPPPPPTVAVDGSSTPHKDYNNWFRQDRLLFANELQQMYYPAANELQQQLAEANARWEEQQRINAMMQQQINKLMSMQGGQGSSSFYYPGFETNQEKDQEEEEEEDDDDDEDE